MTFYQGVLIGYAAGVLLTLWATKKQAEAVNKPKKLDIHPSAYRRAKRKKEKPYGNNQ